MPHEPKETEIKVLLTEDEAERLRARLGPPVRTLRQVSHFFDTPQDHLAGQKLSLRVREESSLSTDGDADEELTLTVKGAGMRAGALFVRPETEAQFDREVWDRVREGGLNLAAVDAPPMHRLREIFGKLGQDIEELELAPLGFIENTREVYELRAGPPQDAPGGHIDLELLLDHTTYPGGKADYEMESELPQSMAGQGARALRSLFEELGVEWRPSDVGKYVRFRRHIGRDVSS